MTLGCLGIPPAATADTRSAVTGSVASGGSPAVTVGERVVRRWRIPTKGLRPKFSVRWRHSGNAWRTLERGRVPDSGAVTSAFKPRTRGRYVLQVRVARTERTRARTLQQAFVVRPRETPDPITASPLARLQPAIGAGSSFQAYAVGDIGWCDDENPGNAAQRATSALIPDGAMLLGLGDLAQNDGTRKNFRDCYLPAYGRLMGTTYPVPGNHEYKDPALAYFPVFGERVGTERRSWYGFQHGGWSFYQMNSNCHADGLDDCAPRSRQLRWLDAQLAIDTNRCVAVSWHHPHWAAAPKGDYERTDHLYALLVKHRVDLLLGGHWHNYQRFARLGLDGTPDPRAPRQFVVGTGGARLDVPLRNTKPRPEVARKTAHGVLRLDFRPDGYGWQFLSVGGAAVDAGADTCS